MMAQSALMGRIQLFGTHMPSDLEDTLGIIEAFKTYFSHIRKMKALA